MNFYNTAYQSKQVTSAMYYLFGLPMVRIELHYAGYNPGDPAIRYMNKLGVDKYIYFDSYKNKHLMLTGTKEELESKIVMLLGFVISEYHISGRNIQPISEKRKSVCDRMKDILEEPEIVEYLLTHTEYKIPLTKIPEDMKRILEVTLEGNHKL